MHACIQDLNRDHASRHIKQGCMGVQVARISRIINTPRGCALVVGMHGSARHTLTRLACAMASSAILEWTMPKDSPLDTTNEKSHGIPPGYVYKSTPGGSSGGGGSGGGSSKMKAFMMEQLKAAIKMAGVCAENVTMIIDLESADDETLDMVNHYVSTGQLPQILSKEDMDAIVDDVSGAATHDTERKQTPNNLRASSSILTIAGQESDDEGSMRSSHSAALAGIKHTTNTGAGKSGIDIYSRFLQSVRECFHVILCCSPGGRLQHAMRAFPRIPNFCTSVPFRPWEVRNCSTPHLQSPVCQPSPTCVGVRACACVLLCDVKVAMALWF
jgi:hypothetical protein